MREMLRAGSDQAASALGRHVAAGRDLVEAADPQRRIASMRANDVVDRYFSRTYLVDAAGPGQDQFVHWHSNKLSVVGMSPAHPLVARCRARLAAPDSGASNAADAPSGDLPAALQAALAGRETVALPDDSCQASVAEGRFIKRVEYKVGTKRPTGKRKKGAEFLAPDSVLCVVTDTEGQEHSVVAYDHAAPLSVHSLTVAPLAGAAACGAACSRSTFASSPTRTSSSHTCVPMPRGPFCSRGACP